MDIGLALKLKSDVNLMLPPFLHLFHINPKEAAIHHLVQTLMFVSWFFFMLKMLFEYPKKQKQNTKKQEKTIFHFQVTVTKNITVGS